MGKSKAVDAVGKLVALLESVESNDRPRVISAALTLLGDDPETNPEGVRGVVQNLGRGPAGREEKGYFDSKDPKTKGEELAVAARYREERDNATSSTRADLERVIRGARRNFDGGNFRRDLENARTKGFFTRGTGRDAIVLSHWGQNYVDALPNRKAAEELGAPVVSLAV